MLELPGPLEIISFYPIIQKTTQSETETTIVAYFRPPMNDFVGTELEANLGLSAPCFVLYVMLACFFKPK